MVEIKLEQQETVHFWIRAMGSLFLMALSLFAFMWFVFRGVQFEEFTPFKVALILFLPYGFLSVYRSFRVLCRKMKFEEGWITVVYPFGKSRYSTSSISGVDLTFGDLGIDIVLLDEKNKAIAVLKRSRRWFRDWAIVRRAARVSGINSLK